MIHQNQYLKEIGAEYLSEIQAIKLSNGTLITEEEFRRWGGQDLREINSKSLTEFLCYLEKR